VTSHADLAPMCEHEAGCITCGDTALPLEVVRVDEARALALCADGSGQRETVQIELVGPVGPGERLLVHAGTALQRLEAGP
jgi:hydrogenase maturation factor